MGERVSFQDRRRLGLVGTAAIFLATGCTLAVDNNQTTQLIGADNHNCQAVANSNSREENGKPLPADDTDTQINLIVTYDIDAINQPVRLFLKHQDAEFPNIIYDYSTRSNATFIPDNALDPKEPDRGKIKAVGLYRDRDYYSIGFGATHDPTFKAGAYSLKVVSESEGANSYCNITNAFEIIEESTG